MAPGIGRFPVSFGRQMIFCVPTLVGLSWVREPICQHCRALYLASTTRGLLAWNPRCARGVGGPAGELAPCVGQSETDCCEYRPATELVEERTNAAELRKVRQERRRSAPRKGDLRQRSHQRWRCTRQHYYNARKISDMKKPPRTSRRKLGASSLGE